MSTNEHVANSVVATSGSSHVAAAVYPTYILYQYQWLAGQGKAQNTLVRVVGSLAEAEQWGKYYTGDGKTKIAVFGWSGPGSAPDSFYSGPRLDGPSGLHRQMMSWESQQQPHSHPMTPTMHPPISGTDDDLLSVGLAFFVGSDVEEIQAPMVDTSALSNFAKQAAKQVSDEAYGALADERAAKDAADPKVTAFPGVPKAIITDPKPAPKPRPQARPVARPTPVVQPPQPAVAPSAQIPSDGPDYVTYGAAALVAVGVLALASQYFGGSGEPQKAALPVG